MEWEYAVVGERLLYVAMTTMLNLGIPSSPLDVSYTYLHNL